jgi:hypothetical protein
MNDEIKFKEKVENLSRIIELTKDSGDQQFYIGELKKLILEVKEQEKQLKSLLESAERKNFDNMLLKLLNTLQERYEGDIVETKFNNACIGLIEDGDITRDLYENFCDRYNINKVPIDDDDDEGWYSLSLL